MSGLNSFLCVHRHGKSGADSVLSCVQLTEHGSHGCCTAVGHPRTGVWQNRMLLSFSSLCALCTISLSRLFSVSAVLFLTLRGGRPLVFALCAFYVQQCDEQCRLCWTEERACFFGMLFVCGDLTLKLMRDAEICHRFRTGCVRQFAPLQITRLWEIGVLRNSAGCAQGDVLILSRVANQSLLKWFSTCYSPMQNILFMMTLVLLIICLITTGVKIPLYLIEIAGVYY